MAYGLLGSGPESLIVEVECRLSNNLPLIVIIGSASRTVHEARDRLRSAFASSNLRLPRRRITINLAPADMPKDDSGLDLAMASSILQTNSETAVSFRNKKWAAIGELGLDGSVRPVRGIIGRLLAGRAQGITTYLIPAANLAQAQLVPNIALLPIASLDDLYRYLSGIDDIRPLVTGSGIMHIPAKIAGVDSDPLLDIAGQEQAKRALIIAAAGGHNILMYGPPGTGKSLLAKTLGSLLPPPTQDEMLEITQLASLADHNYERLVTTRPVRQPHHTTSAKSIIGNSHTGRPGEISLSHRGVLLLDELPEFSRQTLESLRQPLEDKYVQVSTNKYTYRYPANFILAATANPCPCGFNGSTTHTCTCTPAMLARYKARLSGPVIDRIDLVCSVHPIDHKKILRTKSEPKNNIVQQIVHARTLQATRHGTVLLNSDLSTTQIKAYAQIAPTAQALLDSAAASLHLSPRAYTRVIKVGRTIADLADSAKITATHISEALTYRQRYN